VPSAWPGRAPGLRAWVFAAVLAAVAAPAAVRADSILPDPALTPGSVVTTDAAKVCTPGYARRARNVPLAVKRAAFARYGLRYVRGRYEVDHLISLELGGSNALDNLWPEPYAIAKNGINVGARVKDRLERELHRRVCAGGLTLPQAQRAIRTFWTNAFRTYLGPL
jgi:hypothetical protein